MNGKITELTTYLPYSPSISTNIEIKSPIDENCIQPVTSTTNINPTISHIQKENTNTSLSLSPSSISTSAPSLPLPLPSPSLSSPALVPPSSSLNSTSWADVFWQTASSSERLCQFCYNYSILLSFANQTWIILLFDLVDPVVLKTGSSLNPTMIALLLIFQLLQLLIMFAAHKGMLKELLALYVRPTKIWNMYLSVVVSFAALYFTFFAFFRSSFNVDGYAPDASNDNNIDNDPTNDLQTYNDVPTIFLFFVYFSGAIMTSTGFGDIAPAMYYSQAATNCQMLMGTIYHVGVFGLTLAHFRTFIKMSAEEQSNKEAQGKSYVTLVMDAVDKMQISEKLRRISPLFDTMRHFCVKYLAFVSIIFQAIITSLLFAIPSPFTALTSSDGSAYTYKMIVISIMIVLQAILFISVLFISLRLVRSINNKDLSASFLIQSYIATALLFGGIYFILFAATPHHQFSRNTEFDMSIYEVLYVFIHFSLTVMTTTGFGDIYARGLIARMFVLVEMLVSILYNAVIIGLGTSQLIDLQSSKAELEFQKMKQLKIEKNKIKKGKFNNKKTKETKEFKNKLKKKGQINFSPEINCDNKSNINKNPQLHSHIEDEKEEFDSFSSFLQEEGGEEKAVEYTDQNFDDNNKNYNNNEESIEVTKFG